MFESRSTPKCRRVGVSGPIERAGVSKQGVTSGGNRPGLLAVLVLAAWVTGTGVAVAQGRADGPPNALTQSTADTFSHNRHQRLPCMTCHLSSSGSMLTFEPPRGCQICHHVEQARDGCTQCHEPGSVPDTLAVQVTIAAADDPPLERTVSFRHAWHTNLDCTSCHGTRVTMEPVDSAQTCQGCHVEHHQEGRACATCHRTESIRQPHAPPIQAHAACDRCHATAAIAPLTPTRSFCLMCHDPAVDHHPERQCVVCHLQASPEAYRALLLKN
jgi:hypothetical protein